MTMNDYLDKANNYYYEGKFNEALTSCDLGIEKNPQSALYNLRGCINEELGKYHEAEKDWRMAKRIDRNSPLPDSNLGWLYKERFNNPEKALEHYDKAIEKGKRRYLYDIKNAISGKAECLLRLGRYEESYKYYIIAAEMRYPSYNPRKLVKLIQPDNIEQLETAYKELSKAGFYPVSEGEPGKCLITMPLFGDRMIIHIDNFHISETCKKHMEKMGDKYKISIDTHFNEIMDRLDYYYMKESELSMKKFRWIYSNKKDNSSDFRLISIALTLEGHLAAGALGAITGNESSKNRLFLGFTRYHDISGSGNVLDKLLADELKNAGVIIMDYGPASATRWIGYKKRLGAVKMTTEEFIRYRNNLESKNREDL